jgi:hypothetical protein
LVTTKANWASDFAVTSGVFNGFTPIAGMDFEPSAPWQPAHLALKIAAPSAAKSGIAMVATIANAKNLFIDSPVLFYILKAAMGSGTLLPLLQDLYGFRIHSTLAAVSPLTSFRDFDHTPD